MKNNVISATCSPSNHIQFNEIIDRRNADETLAKEWERHPYGSKAWIDTYYAFMANLTRLVDLKTSILKTKAIRN